MERRRGGLEDRPTARSCFSIRTWFQIYFPLFLPSSSRARHCSLGPFSRMKTTTLLTTSSLGCTTKTCKNGISLAPNDNKRSTHHANRSSSLPRPPNDISIEDLLINELPQPRRAPHQEHRSLLEPLDNAQRDLHLLLPYPDQRSEENNIRLPSLSTHLGRVGADEPHDPLSRNSNFLADRRSSHDGADEVLAEVESFRVVVDAGKDAVCRGREEVAEEEEGGEGERTSCGMREISR